MINKVIRLKNYLSGDKKGATLLELIVSVAIFAGFIVAATGIFQSVIEGQRNSIVSQNTQESMRYVFDVISKEIRNAVGDYDGSTCPDPPGINQPNKVFNTNTVELYFMNDNGDCIRYYVQNDRFYIDRDGVALPITPDEIEISNIWFEVLDNPASIAPDVQPRVYIRMEADMDINNKAGQKIIMQTAISSRYYE